MDEPLSNLDAKLRQQMRADLRQLQRRLGLTVIYVTHDQVEAMTMADKVVVMRHGRVDQIADPLSLYRAPASASVARFIGSPPMNLIRARAIDGGFQIAGSTLKIAMKRNMISAGEEVLLGIRPEDLTLGDGDLRFEAQLASAELLGADQLAKMTLDGNDEIIARVHNATRLEEGQRYTIGAREENLHLFRAESGERIKGFKEEVRNAVHA
jgi:ABC-type sugar transport system ATPase subunit